MDNYEILKNRTSKRNRIYSHLDRIKKTFSQEDCLAPITLEIFPTNRCNSKCYFCAYPKVDSDELSNSVFESLINSCIKIGVKGITFSGGGEPTLHKYLPTAIDRLTEAGISVGLITNGVYISDELYKVVNKCSWIRFSLLTSQAKEYYAFTNLKEEIFDNVLKNIKRVTRNKKNLIVGATMMLNDQNTNLDSIVSYLNLASELELDQIFFTEMVDGIGNFKMKKDGMLQYLELIHAMSEEKRVVTNIDKFLSQENVVMSRKEKCPCDMIERNLINVINAKGEVYPCLGQYTIEQAQPLGSLYQLTYENIVKKSNLDYMAEQYIANGCRFCKNSTTRKELDNYFTTKIEKHVRDFHVDFL